MGLGNWKKVGHVVLTRYAVEETGQVDTELIVFGVGGLVLATIGWLVVISDWRGDKPAEGKARRKGKPDPAPQEQDKEFGSYVISNAAACLAAILSGLVLSVLGVVLSDSGLLPRGVAAVLVWGGVAMLVLAVIFVVTIGLFNWPRFLVRPNLRAERGWLGRKGN